MLVQLIFKVNFASAFVKLYVWLTPHFQAYSDKLNWAFTVA